MNTKEKLSEDTQEQSCKSGVMQSVLLPTELRIGNLTSAGVVVEIQKECFYVHDGKSSLKNTWFDIQSIPLTEEWLVKCGLTKNNGYPYKFLNGFIKIRNGVYFYKYYHLDIELKYVHQLQNLYFSLTQTELTVA
jgi:hypothetical protein